MAPSPTRSRPELRGHYRTRRAALPTPLQQQASLALTARLVERARTQRWRTVLAYAARAGELDLAPALRELRSHGVVVALPRVDGDQLFFHRVDESSALRPGVYDIPTPPADAPIVMPARADAALVPLVAFDDQGTRLGMGGGYYDRLLSRFQRVRRIGVAHDCQRSSRLAVEPWDQRLDEVLTPTMTLTPQTRSIADARVDSRHRP